MPLVIGRNTLTYTGDTSEQQCSYVNSEPIFIADGTEQPLAPPISLSISDKCHHVRIQGNLNIDLPYADMPRVLIKVTSAAGTQAWHTTVYDGSPNNATIDTSTSDPDPISEVQICLMSKAGQDFTLPANSQIHLCVRGCDAVLAGPHAVTGPSVPAAGVQHTTTGTTGSLIVIAGNNSNVSVGDVATWSDPANPSYTTAIVTGVSTNDTADISIDRSVIIAAGTVITFSPP